MHIQLEVQKLQDTVLLKLSVSNNVFSNTLTK